MLHSFRYYASYYYYALLLCLLHQQQQAHSLTIIIDGVTTNEWATRDEYQRLVGGEPQSGQQQPVEGASQQQQQLINGLLGSSSSANQELYQQQQQPLIQQQEAKSAADELESALDRLDLIEEQRQQQQQQQRSQKHLKQQQRHNRLRAGLHQHQDELAGKSSDELGATSPLRSNEPFEERKLEAISGRLKERELSRKKLCGPELMEALEVVCQHRFYGGSSEPQIVEPTIKTKRSFIGRITSNGNTADEQQANGQLATLNNQINEGSFSHKNNFHGRPLFRRIRGANAECCRRGCHMDDLKLYCEQK